ncbi:hypothetical protein [uncultured Tateyamaria sp.]|uniref:hypothetical protein n=1 Tax=uncultured Tateyamaria sp. TaxID=455651 RepID=UPI0026343D0D|nr:hypothetical protein [uncultured Tateyamaria sp.]
MDLLNAFLPLCSFFLLLAIAYCALGVRLIHRTPILIDRTKGQPNAGGCGRRQGSADPKPRKKFLGR